MDGALILIVALVLILKRSNVPIEEQEQAPMRRETKLNPDFYEDENAFMEVAHELGFH